MVQSAKHVVITVYDHDGAQRQAHEKKGKGLQAIEIAQELFLQTEHIDYSRCGVPRKKGKS
jgi:hypothetical protein